jgi:predicted nuclease of predicted toxin-antitoxin system
MRFLADENCDFTVVQALRAADSEVIKLADDEKRIVLTEDKDFGQLVYSHGQKTLGVIFLRFPTSARRQISRAVIKLVKQQGEKLAGCFITVQPGRIRISHAP